jgi:hypothetical protein
VDSHCNEFDPQSQRFGNLTEVNSENTLPESALAIQSKEGENVNPGRIDTAPPADYKAFAP